MTNEELMQKLNDGEDVAEKLYHKNEGLLFELAKKVAASFHCLQYRENTKRLTDYSRQIIEELKHEGAVEFFRLLRAGEYDASRGKLTTYVYPYLHGVMHRWMEANLGVLSLGKDDMDMLRAVQKEYYLEGKSEEEIAETHGLSAEEVYRYVGYNTHFLSVNDLVSEDAYDSGEAFDPFEYLNPETDETASVDYAVYRKICLELLHELFLFLPEKDRQILGETTGLFGIKRKPLEEIALEEMLTVDGVIKARNAAVRKMKERYPGSKLQQWRIVHRIVLRTAERGGD